MAINIICPACKSNCALRTNICKKCSNDLKSGSRKYRVVVGRYDGRRITRELKSLSIAKKYEGKLKSQILDTNYLASKECPQLTRYVKSICHGLWKTKRVGKMIKLDGSFTLRHIFGVKKWTLSRHMWQDKWSVDPYGLGPIHVTNVYTKPSYSGYSRKSVSCFLATRHSDNHGF